MVATLLPYCTQGVHLFFIIVYEDGRFESSEKLIGDRSIYHKESGALGADELERLSVLLKSLDETSASLFATSKFHDVDPFDFESNDRRSIGFMADKKPSLLSTTFLNYSSGNKDVAMCKGIFDSIWDLLFRSVSYRRFSMEPFGNASTDPSFS